MVEKFSICALDLISTLSRALDLGREKLPLGISHHGKRVAYLALSLGEEIGLSEEKMQALYLASLFHDAGISSLKRGQSFRKLECELPQKHAEEGYELLKQFPKFEEIALIVRSHHDRWRGGNLSNLQRDRIPFLSTIIFVADRIDCLIEKREYILFQKDRILKDIKDSRGILFNPKVVEALLKVGKRESFWLPLTGGFIEDILKKYEPTSIWLLGREELKKIAGIFAKIVDRKSKFTYKHSEGVARTAVFLGKQMGFSENELGLLEIAGLLHDLGKIGIPNEILNKPASLTKREFEVMKRHTFYTYYILSGLKEFKELGEWAAFHHERLDGKGYPFHRDRDTLSLGAKIMAVADKFSALNQERPYRKPFSKEEILKILKKEAREGGIDPLLFSLLEKNYSSLCQEVHPLYLSQGSDPSI